MFCRMCALPTPMSASTISVRPRLANREPSDALTTDLPVPPLPLAMHRELARTLAKGSVSVRVGACCAQGGEPRCAPDGAPGCALERPLACALDNPLGRAPDSATPPPPCVS